MDNDLRIAGNRSTGNEMLASDGAREDSGYLGLINMLPEKIRAPVLELTK